MAHPVARACRSRVITAGAGSTWPDRGPFSGLHLTAPIEFEHKGARNDLHARRAESRPEVTRRAGYTPGRRGGARVSEYPRTTIGMNTQGAQPLRRFAT